MLNWIEFVLYKDAYHVTSGMADVKKTPCFLNTEKRKQKQKAEAERQLWKDVGQS